MNKDHGQTKQFDIRPIRPDDLDACIPLLLAVYNGPPWHDHWTEATGRRYIEEFLSHPRLMGYVCLVGNQISASILCHKRTYMELDEVFVNELFVHPEHQRSGIGRALLARLEADCREEGLGAVTLLTDKHMPAAAFYRKNNYVMSEKMVFFHKRV